MKSKLTKESVIVAAATLADEQGGDALTLKNLAVKLHIKSPSLYKHINGLDDLRSAVMLYGWKILTKELTQAAVGRAGDDALRSIFYAYRTFALSHKGLFEVMQWYNMHLSDSHLDATADIVSVLFRVLDAYSLTEKEKVHTVRMCRGFLQGYVTTEGHGGFGTPNPTEESFEFALQLLLRGIKSTETSSC